MAPSLDAEGPVVAAGVFAALAAGRADAAGGVGGDGYTGSGGDLWGATDAGYLVADVSQIGLPMPVHSSRSRVRVGEETTAETSSPMRQARAMLCTKTKRRMAPSRP